jgi:hypothetical protein
MVMTRKLNTEVIGLKTIRMNKPTKWQSAINVIHRNWCRDNGYPTNWYRARYGRPPMHKRKGTSEQIEKR